MYFGIKLNIYNKLDWQSFWSVVIFVTGELLALFDDPGVDMVKHERLVVRQQFYVAAVFFVFFLIRSSVWVILMPCNFSSTTQTHQSIFAFLLYFPPTYLIKKKLNVARCWRLPLTLSETCNERPPWWQSTPLLRPIFLNSISCLYGIIWRPCQNADRLPQRHCMMICWWN